MFSIILTILLGAVSALAGDANLTISAGLNAVSDQSHSSLNHQPSCPACSDLKAADPIALEQELQSEAPVPPDFAIKDASPLNWEKSDHPERVYWSRYVFKVVSSVLDDLNKAKDIEKFCPNYRTLTRDQQVVTWAQLFSSVSYWESSYDPTNNTMEEGEDKGTDSVTNLPVYSSGLLQLSYQDIHTYKEQGFCHFDWEKDKLLGPQDEHRTIFNPYTNLYCGINIMAANVKRIGKIVSSNSYYWATLQNGNLAEDRHGQIMRMVHRLPFCGGNEIIDFTLGHTIDRALEFFHDHFQ